jgi:predicted amino acid-binding ACT domain protein
VNDMIFDSLLSLSVMLIEIAFMITVNSRNSKMTEMEIRAEIQKLEQTIQMTRQEIIEAIHAHAHQSKSGN